MKLDFLRLNLVLPMGLAVFLFKRPFFFKVECAAIK